eukprot:8532952-Pyramimonas_sp.AAC.1
MASVERILEEIRGSARVIEAHAQIHSDPTSTARVMVCLGQSLCAMIRTLQQSLSSDDTSDLLMAISRSGFTVDQKQELSLAVEQKLTMSRISPGLAPHDTQKWAKSGSILNYMTAKDLELIRDPSA